MSLCTEKNSATFFSVHMVYVLVIVTLQGIKNRVETPSIFPVLSEAPRTGPSWDLFLGAGHLQLEITMLWRKKFAWFSGMGYTYVHDLET